MRRADRRADLIDIWLSRAADESTDSGRSDRLAVYAIEEFIRQRPFIK